MTVLRRVGLRDFLAKLLDLFFGGVGDLDPLALRDLDLLEAGDRDLLRLGDLFDFLSGVRDLEEEEDDDDEEELLKKKTLLLGVSQTSFWVNWI